MSRASKIVATLVLLICFFCPLAELFDYWDDSVQTGNDTEYGLVVISLCVGVAYTLGRFVFKRWTILVSKCVFVSGADEPSWSETGCFRPPPLFDDRSPPWLPLRI
jgi:hypothetical protein